MSQLAHLYPIDICAALDPCSGEVLTLAASCNCNAVCLFNCFAGQLDTFSVSAREFQMV